MLPHPTKHAHPFPHFRCASAFAPETTALLDRLFLVEADWQHRDAAFYQCFLREITGELPPALLRRLLVRMREITDLPLIDHVHVTAQRMEPGQRIGVHSDRPLLGYEMVRLVVQLTTDGDPVHGGVLELFESPDGPASSKLPPRYNQAFGFVLHPDSHHGVTAVTRQRRSMVFNFWHIANTPQLEAAVSSLFSEVRFSNLPRALDAVASQAEASLPEETTFRAAMAATALQRWGYEDHIVVDGYLSAAGMQDDRERTEEDQLAVGLADWTARLALDPFDLSRWTSLRRHLASARRFPRLAPMALLCFPEAEQAVSG